MEPTLTLYGPWRRQSAGYRANIKAGKRGTVHIIAYDGGEVERLPSGRWTCVKRGTASEVDHIRLDLNA